MDTLRALASSDLFSNLTAASREKLGPYSSPLSFEVGDVLFREGSAAISLFAVTNGQVQLSMAIGERDGSVKRVALTTASPGQSIGFWGLIPPYRNPFSAVALTRVAAIAVDAQQLRETMASDPELARELLSQVVVVLARRLKETREVLGYERARRSG